MRGTCQLSSTQSQLNPLTYMSWHVSVRQSVPAYAEPASWMLMFSESQVNCIREGLSLSRSPLYAQCLEPQWGQSRNTRQLLSEWAARVYSRACRVALEPHVVSKWALFGRIIFFIFNLEAFQWAFSLVYISLHQNPAVSYWRYLPRIWRRLILWVRE